ncbi:MAG: hypothetical protein KatS3mg045_1855 [Bellilinea sp.]|nr:MAG: hypothetical protein KatS3mg045_1855 [Bellilinea sp.]
MRVEPAPKDNLAEIAISGNQDRLHTVGNRKDFIIRNSRLHLCDVLDLMTILPQTFHNSSIDAFISHEIHAASSAKG